MNTFFSNTGKGVKLINTIFLFFLIVAGFIFCRPVSSLPGSEKLQKTFSITGKVTQTFSYCGGAAPTKQILDALRTPVPYSGKKFYIRPGNINSTGNKIIKSFTTDSLGTFSFSLSPGSYAIIQEEQVGKIKASDYTNKTQQADEKCLQEWWAKPYYLLEVKDGNINELNFSFNHPCFLSVDIPCLQYTGPPIP